MTKITKEERTTMTSETRKPFNLLIAATGSVATVKIPLLIQKLKEKYKQVSINLILTKNSEFFLQQEELEEIEQKCSCGIFRDEDEWKTWNKIGDPIIHIDLMKWADMLMITPLDANTMAKLAQGICDNLLCSLCRAWDFGKPIVVAPAMNTLMWGHPITSTHVASLVKWGYEILSPISKKLACGDTGIGAMVEVDEIVRFVGEKIN